MFDPQHVRDCPRCHQIGEYIKARLPAGTASLEEFSEALRAMPSIEMPAGDYDHLTLFGLYGPPFDIGGVPLIRVPD
jgi:hypothetical protein